jgi:hypothetical protein
MRLYELRNVYFDSVNESVNESMAARRLASSTFAAAPIKITRLINFINYCSIRKERGGYGQFTAFVLHGLLSVTLCYFVSTKCHKFNGFFPCPP